MLIAVDAMFNVFVMDFEVINIAIEGLGNKYTEDSAMIIDSE